MDESLFDEFGNYIGPEKPLFVQDEGASYLSPSAFANGEDEFAGDQDALSADHNHTYRQQIVLHEDKKYYLSAGEVYGPDVETLVQDEDSQPLTVPIITALKVKTFQHEEETPPPTTYHLQYLVGLMGNTSRVRNIAVVGHLHHGKTSLLDVLVAAVHPYVRVTYDRMPNYTDSLFLEQERKTTLKAKPITLLLPDLKGTSMVLNIMDTPGHVDFSDEVGAALRMADGVVLVVDAIEGVMCQTEALIKRAVAEGLSITLVLNKCERLFLELKLPPTDAYYKLRHTVDQINTLLMECGVRETDLLSPEKNNVLFASTCAGWIFSLRSFATVYRRRMFREERSFDVEELSHRLWGDVYYDSERGTFRKSPTEGSTKRTFIAFILEPLYKIYAQVLGEEKDALQEVLAQIGITLRDAEYRQDSRTVLKTVMDHFLGAVPGFVDAVVSSTPNPEEAAFSRVVRAFAGSLDSPMCLAAQKCSSAGPLIAFASKIYPRGDATKFDVLVRVFSGTLKTHQRILVMGESFTAEDPDDSGEFLVAGLSVGCSRYRIPVSSVPAGCWALVSGIEAGIGKTATIVEAGGSSLAPLGIFRPLAATNRPLLKVAIEPVTPSELPKMLDGLRKISKTYPSLTTKVEDSGEQTILGTGELYLDSALHDLRRLYADIEIKVADPVAKFAETVAETSFLKCFAETPNRLNKITVIAEPMERGLAEALESGRLPSPSRGGEEARELANILQREFGWDILAARSVWAFGPDELRGPNILIDDTLPSEVDKDTLWMAKEHLTQGFQWACREGPLCEEGVRGVKFKIIEAVVASDPAHRGAGQIVPTARRVCYSAMLTATPRIMEPVSFVEISTQNDFTEAVYGLLAKHRGHVLQDTPKAGSPLYVIRAYLPLMDSFGFESDLRIHTHGMAFCQMLHDHWQIAPGDPLDRTIKLIPLEPSPAPYLARDFMLKTRRRKGLGEDVAITKFFDEPMLAELAREEAISGMQGLSV